MTTYKRSFTTALCLAVLTLAGCHSTPGPQADSSVAPKSTVASTPKVPFDPCSVLTPAEVTAVTTDPVSKTERIGPDCHYHTTFEEDGTKLSIYRTGGKEQMQDIREAMKVLGGIGTAVSGQPSVGKDVKSAITAPSGGAPAIGDEAMWEPNDVLAVRKGDVFVEVTPTVVHDPASHHGRMMASDADKRAIAQKLAEAVLAKLAP